MATVSGILDWLVGQQILSSEAAEELKRIDDLPSLARGLIERGLLTPYQANQILSDKADTLVLGPYRLVERIGEGAMGQVYKAWNTKLQRPVAVKMIHKEHLASKKAMDRFRREMETASQLDHPNIVHVYDADENESQPYMVMELVDGANLSRMVKQGGPLPIHVACEYARQAALGLQHAYECGVVHRDIKPSNLFVTDKTAEEPDTVKILDFGLARFDDARAAYGRLTQPGAVLGTIDFMAPEQADSAATADARCDIYSLGCTLFFLLTGRPPFPGECAVEKIAARRAGNAPRVADFRTDVPEGLDDVLGKMLASDPAERYQTPQEVAQDLKPFTVPVQRPADAPKAPLVPVSPPPPASPFAQPVFVEHSSSESSLFSFGIKNRFAPPSSMDATQDSPAPAKESRTARKSTQRSKKRLWIWLTAGAAAAVLLAIVLAVAISTAANNVPGPGPGPIVTDGPTDKPGVTPTLHVRMLSQEPISAAAGSVIRPIVQVERTGFRGEVSVTLEGLPDGVSAEPAHIGPAIDKGELRITISFGTPSQEIPATLIAVAGELQARAQVILKVGAPAATLKKLKQ